MKFLILLFQYHCYLWARCGTCCGLILTGEKGKRGRWMVDGGGGGGVRCWRIMAAVHRALPHSFDWMLKGVSPAGGGE